MKYISENRLQDFEFHDAELLSISFINDCLTLEADYLNVHSDAIQNPFDVDMEIEKAVLSFSGFKVYSYEIGRSWTINEAGEYYTDGPQVILFADEATQRFMKQRTAKITVFDFGIKDNGIYFMDAMADDPFFTVCFSFDTATVSWDRFEKKAWYTEPKCQCYFYLNFTLFGCFLEEHPFYLP